MIKTSQEIQLMREAAAISVRIMDELRQAVAPGISALQLDDLMGKLCVKNDVEAAFKGVGEAASPFPGNLCVSVNEQILHTIPRRERVIKQGDTVKLDMGIIYKGFFTDHCITVGVGELAAEDQRLVQIAKLAVESAIPKAIVGNTTGDLGYTMQSIVQLAGFDVLKGYVGHGIGKKLHEEPEVPAYGLPGRGTKLHAGEVLCVEAQVVAGNDKVETAADGWTVSTLDGGNTAMFEYMVLITDDGPEVLTDTRAWEIMV